MLPFSTPFGTKGLILILRIIKAYQVIYTDRAPYYTTEDVFDGVQVILLQVNI